MAFKVRKIDPLDLQPRKAVGVKLPFSGRAVFNSTFQSKDAVKTNLINYFLTGKNERYMNPDFGNSLQPLLFDQMNENKLIEIETLVRRDLKEYFPKVIPSDISVIGIPDTNVVQFSLRFSIKDTGIEDEVILNFEQ